MLIKYAQCYNGSFVILEENWYAELKVSYDEIDFTVQGDFANCIAYAKLTLPDGSTFEDEEYYGMNFQP